MSYGAGRAAPAVIRVAAFLPLSLSYGAGRAAPAVIRVAAFVYGG